jgi:hypothetical protein
MTCVLDLEGIAMEQLVAFKALFSTLFLMYFVAYASEVFSSSPVGLSSSDSYTHGFFTSGSAGCASGCCTVPVVKLFILFLGSP